MWVARDKDGKLKMFSDKPIRNRFWLDVDCTIMKENWIRDTSKYPPIHYASIDGLYNPHYQITYLDNNLFPDLKWEDEPLEVEIVSIKDQKEIYHDLVDMKTKYIDINNKN